MPGFRIDPIRLETEVEIEALEWYLKSLEDHLAIAADVALPEIEDIAQVQADDDEMAASLAHDRITLLRDWTFPRLFRGAFLVMVFAVFEDSVKLWAKSAEARRRSPVAFIWRDQGPFGR